MHLDESNKILLDYVLIYILKTKKQIKINKWIVSKSKCSFVSELGGGSLSNYVKLKL